LRNLILKRLLLLLPIIWGVATIVFVITHLIPGDPVDLILGETARPSHREELRKAMGLDKPVHQQYTNYMKQLLQGDLGKSIHRKEKVSSLIIKKAKASFELAFSSIIVAIFIALPLGIASARSPGSWLDIISSIIAVIGGSVPVFWLGPILIICFSIGTGWFPVSGREGIESIILPALTLGASLSAVLMRMIRSSFLEILPQDFLATAKAKGLSERRVIFIHAFRNACLPIITILSLQLGALLTGTIITETVFAWPGVGRLIIQSISARDYQLVQGCVIFIATVYIITNLLADILYGLLDPRIRIDQNV